jgi:hypothetical protein
MVTPSPGVVGGPGEVVDRWLHAVPEDVPLVLVPHSNAGLYVAALAEKRNVRGMVFTDAGLPSRGPSTRTAPDAFRKLLAGLVETRALVEAEEVRLPLAYVEAHLRFAFALKCTV